MTFSHQAGGGAMLCCQHTQWAGKEWHLKVTKSNFRQHLYGNMWSDQMSTNIQPNSSVHKTDEFMDKQLMPIVNYGGWYVVLWAWFKVIKNIVNWTLYVSWSFLQDNDAKYAAPKKRKYKSFSAFFQDQNQSLPNPADKLWAQLKVKTIKSLTVWDR